MSQILGVVSVMGQERRVALLAANVIASCKEIGNLEGNDDVEVKEVEER